MRECGMLLPVASLPSRYGIGAFSKEAYEFVDTLKKAGQGYWQILPLGPTGFGDSPYQSFSAFAGNPYFIDLERLTQEGLLTKEECEAADFGDDPRNIDYAKVYEGRFTLLYKAYDRFKAQLDGKGAGAVHALAETALGDETREYCFYLAVKNHFRSESFEQWDEDIRLRRPEALSRYRECLSDEIGFYEFQQLKFEQQWERLKKYANERGIKIIGDIPIYVAYDGADSWAHPELFQLDANRRRKAVAGCPPDGFSATGQVWGNPLYDWPYHEKTGYAWWIKRMEYCFKLYDVVRVDHFRGFDEYYSIPSGEDTAASGHWEKGPGAAVFQAMRERFHKEKLPIIAEDLGFLTPSVKELLEETGFPGMKILQFAFDSREESNYLPHSYTKNSVVYTGTHDNDTIVGWYLAMDPADREFSREYMGNERTPLREIHWDFVRMALASVSDLAVIPVQDYLGLGHDARINAPSTLGANWRFRLLPGEFTDELAEKCRRLAVIYERCPAR